MMKTPSQGVKLEGMNTEFLDHLAEQLRVGKSAACRRAIARILTAMKERCERDEYVSKSEAELAFRELVDGESLCQKAHSRTKE
jgi:ribosomal protein L29